MTRVETILEGVNTELGRTRERVHELINSNQRLVSATEATEEAQARIAEKVDVLAQKIETGTLASARAETSLGATLAAHIEQCKTDKAEIRSMLTSGLSEQKGMHAENKKTLDDQQKRLTRIEVRIAAYTGGAVVVTWLAGHGLELIEKLFK